MINIADLNGEEELMIAYSKTLVAMPCNPNSNEHKVVQGLMDVHTTNSLIEPSRLENELNVYSKKGLVDKSNTLAWMSAIVFSNPQELLKFQKLISLHLPRIENFQ